MNATTSRTWRDRMAETSELAKTETDNFRHFAILDLATERILANATQEVR